MSTFPRSLRRLALCLYVTCPALERPSALHFQFPRSVQVLSFWYGGSWDSGSASFPLYWATQDLENYPDVIVVTSNYRLNAFGFLASHALRAQDPDGTTGNYGIQDQRAALRWIQANIAYFGGDPSQVTIQGESAGAGSVSNHLVMPRSSGLFHRGITESGPFAPWSAQPLSVALVKHNQIAIHVGCFSPSNPAASASDLSDDEAERAASDPQVLACLRTKSAKELHDAAGHTPEGLLRWSPVVDGVELFDTPANLAAAGKIANPVPVIGGFNGNEGSLFMPDDIPHNLNSSGYRDTVAAFLQNETAADVLVGLYPVQQFQSPWWAVSAILGGGGMKCPTRASARALSAKGMPYYQYYFTHELEVVRLFLQSEYLGVFHGSELLMVFDLELGLWTSAEKELSRTFVQYWYNFVATGDPNGPGLPKWPVWDSTDPVQVLDTATDGGMGVHTEHAIMKAQCDYWDNSPVPLGVVFGTPDSPSASTSTASLSKLTYKHRDVGRGIEFVLRETKRQ